MVMKNYSTLSG